MVIEIKPVFVLFNITSKILDDNILEAVDNSIGVEIVVNGIMEIDKDADQFGYLIVKFSSDEDFKAFLIAWKLANSYELRYFICQGSAAKIYETFHVDEIDE